MKTDKSNAQTEIEQSKNRISYIKDQLKNKQAKAKEAEKENKGNLAQLQKLEMTIQSVKVGCRINYNEFTL